MADLDAIIHTPARLRIMTTLAAVPEGNCISFMRIKDMLEMTAGNLSAHLSKLEAAGYVKVVKTFERKMPASYVELTLEGCAAYQKYLAELRALLTQPAELSSLVDSGPEGG